MCSVLTLIKATVITEINYREALHYINLGAARVEGDDADDVSVVGLQSAGGV